MRRFLYISFAAVVALAILVTGCGGNPNYYKLGQLKLKQEQYTEAVALFDKALALNATYSEALVGKGDALYELGKYQEAVDSYLNARWKQIKIRRQARDACEKALLADPGNDRLWKMKGDFLREKQQWPDAIASYQKALEINPRSYEAWAGVYLSLRRAGRIDEAEQWRQQGIEAGVF